MMIMTLLRVLSAHTYLQSHQERTETSLGPTPYDSRVPRPHSLTYLRLSQKPTDLSPPELRVGSSGRPGLTRRPRAGPAAAAGDLARCSRRPARALPVGGLGRVRQPVRAPGGPDRGGRLLYLTAPREKAGMAGRSASRDRPSGSAGLGEK